MSKVVIGATLRADGTQATETVKGFKAQLREAKEELLKMQQEFGEFSNEALNAAKKVAILKDNIGDANSLVEAFNPDRKFNAVAQSLQGVVGGFTAVQGVMGLVGVEGEEVQKAMLKVQSALALSQGLDDLREAQQSFKNLGTMIKQSTLFIKANEMANKAAAFSMKLFGVSVETTSVSFKVFKGAIAATGIGLLLVVIGEAVSLFNELSSAAEKAAESQRNALDYQNKLIDAGLKAEQDAISRDEALSQSRLKKRGATEKELFEDQQSWQRLRIESYKRALEESEKGSLKEQEIKKELNKALNELEISQNNFQAQQNQKALEKQKAANDKSLSEQKRKGEEAQKLREQELQQARALNEELRKENEVGNAGGGLGSELTKLQQEFDAKAEILRQGNESTLELWEWYWIQRREIETKYAGEERARLIAYYDEQKAKADEAAQAQLESRQRSVDGIVEATKNVVVMESATLEERRNIIAAAEQQILDNTAFTGEQRTQIEQTFSDARKEIDRLEAEAKKGFYNDIAGAMGALSQAIGQQTAVGKGLAVAQATMNTWQGATEVLRAKSLLPEPAGTISKAVNFAAVVATGFKAIKGILSVKVPGAGGGGGIPSVNTTAPVQPQLSTQNTQLQGIRDQINANGNASVRAYVVETDVTDQQSRIRQINRRARLG